jgi:spermidine synthase
MASSIEVSEEAGVRYLHFGSRWVQGAMRVQRPWALELEYTREMLLPLVLRPESEWPRSVLLIGLGAGSLAKFLYRHRPQAALTAVELSPQVVAAAAQFFRLPDDPARLAVEVGDGAAFVATTTRRYDLILLDGFDGRGRAGTLDTPEFYRAARQRLSASGFLVANLLDRGRGVGASVARIVDAFDQRALILPPSDSGNTVAIAAGGRSVTVELLQLTDRARELKRATGLNLAPTVARFAAAFGGPGAALEL